MPHITIISSSVRQGCLSIRVALYLKLFLEEHKIATVEILDLLLYDFPIFKERCNHLKEWPIGADDFINKIKGADGVIIVTPEYNGGYPASLKNIIDFLYDDWYRKPIAISTVSDGSFGGSQVITSLLFSLWKIRAWVISSTFPIAKVADSFNEQGIAMDKDATDKRAGKFINELLWCIDAKTLKEKSEHNKRINFF